MRGPRVAGVLVIGFALLALLVVPNLGSRVVSGIPVPAPVPGPPAVGECVTSAGPSSWEPVQITTTLSGPSSYTYPQLPMGPCVGARRGEVVSVLLNPRKPAVTAGNEPGFSPLSVNDPNRDACYSAIEKYAGLSAVQPLQPSPYWYISVPMSATASTPSRRQQADGQHWLACIASLRPHDGLGGDPPEPYGFSLRNLFVSGAHRDQIGWCITDTQHADTSPAASCTGLHVGEIFAAGGLVAQRVSRAELTKGCRSIVERQTRLPDVTAGGHLAIQVMITDQDGRSVSSATVPIGATTLCGIGVTGNRRLQGSLLLLGHQPIPWA